MAIIITELKNVRYENIKEILARNIAFLAGRISQMAAGSVRSDEVLSLYSRLASFRTSLQGVAAIPGIDSFVQDAEGEPLYVLTEEIAAMVLLVDDAISWVDTSFPAAGTYIQETQIDDGTITRRTFSTSATSGLRTKLQTIIDFTTT